LGTLLIFFGTAFVGTTKPKTVGLKRELE
jgi:hypothetical protein